MFELNTIKRLALIAGNGKFPLFVCQAAKEKGIEIIALAIKDETQFDLSQYSSKIYTIEIGQARELIDILKNENIKYAIMAGGLKKTTIFKQAFKLDEETRAILKSASAGGDNSILKAASDRLKKEGIQLLSSTMFLDGLLAKKGVYTKQEPSPEQKQDIAYGIKIAKAIGRLDIGQTIIVKDKTVIAVEAIEGTDKAIARCGELTKGAVVIKVSKPRQDMRFDVPTIGINTIEAMKKANASVLAIEAGKTLILEKDTLIKEAQEAKICVVAI